jgi:hypothetical protein
MMPGHTPDRRRFGLASVFVGAGDLVDLLRQIHPCEWGTDPGILIVQVGEAVFRIERASAKATVDEAAPWMALGIS